MNKTRTHGLWLLAGGCVLTAAIVGVANLAFGQGNWHFLGYGFAVPGAMALVGLIQLVSGVPFQSLARAWDGLAGWQRGVLGTLIVLLAIGMIMAVLMVVAFTLYS